MKSPFYFIVSPVDDKRYSNTMNIAGVDFIISTDDEDHHYTNRQAILLSTPRWYNGPAKEGDTLLVHHNVFRLYNDITGYQKGGKSFLKDNQYILDADQFYMYKRDGEWHAHGEYSFVTIPHEGYLIATMEYPSAQLAASGFKNGDMVCFVPGCSYEFNVDGRRLFRLMDKHITVKLNGEG